MTVNDQVDQLEDLLNERSPSDLRYTQEVTLMRTVCGVAHTYVLRWVADGAVHETKPIVGTLSNRLQAMEDNAIDDDVNPFAFTQDGAPHGPDQWLLTAPLGPLAKAPTR